MTTHTVEPSINRTKLGRKLRAARKSAQLTQRKAAEELVWSLSKLIRIENGNVSVSVTDLRGMIELYEITDAAEREELEQAARGSRGTNWWTEYNDVLSTQFSQFLGYETAADSLDLYHPVVIPGQLQTEAYARALLLPRKVEPHTLDRLVALRVARQKRLFDDPDGARIGVVLDEAALRRRIGTPQVMAEQLGCILELAKNPRVEVSVLPLDAGAHFSTTGPFVLLGFPDDTSDLLWVETTVGVLTSRHDTDLLEKYQLCLADISASALTGDDATGVIAAIEQDFRNR